MQPRSTTPVNRAAATPPGEVALIGVTKRYGETRGVTELSLTAADEILTLVGPSGCGKTTTLRLIGGFVLPTAGHIALGGHDMTAVPPYRRPVHTVVQHFALFPHLTVAENLAYPLVMAGVRPAEQARRVTAALDLVRLEGIGRRRPDQLSGGQQQRVALARALVDRPPILLLDEPLGALDTQLRLEMQVELKRLQREVGATFISVTHDQAEAMATADRIAVLNEGRLVEIGPPRQLYEAPRTPFVARFLGQSNVLDGTLAEMREGEGVVRLATGATVRGRVPAAGGPVVGGASAVAIRPERVRVHAAAEPGPAGDNALLATIVDVSFAGAVWRVQTRLASGAEVIARVGPEWEDGGHRRRGDAVTVTFRPQDTLILFDDGGTRAESADH